MTMTDPISDLLTRIRNALQARHAKVSVPNSKIKRAIVEILKQEGFITDYMVLDDRLQGVIEIDLKYHEQTPVVRKIKRISKPGCRVYVNADAIPHTLQGLGLTILSTSKGVLSDFEARKMNVGGEVLCTVY